jgi:hypothetical protein
MFGWLARLFFPEEPEVDTEFAQMARDPDFSNKSLRLEYSKEKLESLPLKNITDEECYEIMCNWTFVIVPLYYDKVTLYPGEVGHDQNYRYALPAIAPQNEHAV